MIVNYYFDPYGFNGRLKHIDSKAVKIFKPYDVIEKEPSTVIIGNSRNYYSFSPSHTGKNSTYNLSFPGIGIAQIRSLYEHILKAEIDIDELIITLDSFCDPLTIRSISNSLDDRVLISEDNPQIRTLVNKVLFYLSLDASYTSYRNIRKPKDNFMSSDGRAVKFNEYNYLKKGPGNALIERESRNIFRRVNRTNSIKAASYSDYKKQCKTVNLDYIINSTIENNIKVSFFLNPVNARYWEIYAHFDGLPSYVHYPKKLIQEKLNTIAEEHQHQFEGFDFLRLNAFTLEPLSYSDIEERTYWYESSHYNLAFGNIVLSNIFDKNFERTQLVANLKDTDLDQDYLKQKSLLEEWRNTNPELNNEIRNSIENSTN
ncbi:MAG: hypothetical protein JAY99_12300 [Candidatus Thiodiazotropha lotti]|uniref:hypothetical protein n=1 Tax=Candidatus Thiodiazotropha endoloripes TaxID=1818881 RepID=UPI00111191F0|nr:hypothetical protein [Candidatus Thiodiazotropha endoloripes]MCG7897941.1 hypothetical protein [Candidatus Thiodiazotropha weberae]MCG7992379.1 hypothetical protein [Candidatus Thiodiazotropha lotti]MCG7903803.1 hypothetical protein [Candidatus Thiodiazotropha weberae]MCG7912785.1 hypothetical protein [Candidatus Thiodiazotropha weberae]MCG8000303.1 hypothetical protein [Candidatus Thiodiazotropha lotti]